MPNEKVITATPVDTVPAGAERIGHLAVVATNEHNEVVAIAKVGNALASPHDAEEIIASCRRRLGGKTSVGLAEDKKFAAGYEAIFGKKKDASEVDPEMN